MNASSPKDSFNVFHSILSKTLPKNANKKQVDVIADLLVRSYSQSHRYWHGLDHIQSMVKAIPQNLPAALTDQLALAILFHDIVYNPRSSDNEEKSAEIFSQNLRWLPEQDKITIQRAILSTKTGKGSTPLEKELNKLDRAILRETDMARLMAYEKAILREYQYVTWPFYQKNRAEFLRKQRHQPLKNLAEYVEQYRPKIGIYAGSFNPFHLGHLDILQKAEKLFDKVIVAVGINPSKPHARETVDSRVKELEQVIPFHEVRSFSTLLVELVEEIQKYADVSLVRGLRDGYDLQKELAQARFNEDLRPGTSTIYVISSREFQHISSRDLRALGTLDPTRVAPYLPRAPL